MNRISSAIFSGVNGLKKSAGKPVAKIKPTTIFHITGLPDAGSFGGCDSDATVGYCSIRFTPLFLTPVHRLRANHRVHSAPAFFLLDTSTALPVRY
jgi:hypothetical protein